MACGGGSEIGRSGVVLGGVMVLILVGGLFFLYGSLQVEPDEPVSPVLPEPTAKTTRPTPTPAVVEAPRIPSNAPKGWSGGDKRLILGSGGTVHVPVPQGKVHSPFHVSGGVPGGIGRGSGASGGGFLK